MSAGLVFGLLAVVAILAAWASKCHVAQKIGLVLLAEWAATNVAFQTLGAHQAMLAVPSINIALAALCATIGFKYKSRIALVVFLLYGVIGVAHIAAFSLRKDGTYPHYLVLNVLFALQLLTVGGASAWVAVRHWIPRGGERLRADPAHRSGLA